MTCGGLCPGLNTVIREIVCGLNYMYGVKRVLGIDVSRVFATLLTILSLILVIKLLDFEFFLFFFREGTGASMRKILLL